MKLKTDFRIPYLQNTNNRQRPRQTYISEKDCLTLTGTFFFLYFLYLSILTCALPNFVTCVSYLSPIINHISRLVGRTSSQFFFLNKYSLGVWSALRRAPIPRLQCIASLFHISAVPLSSASCSYGTDTPHHSSNFCFLSSAKHSHTMLLVIVKEQTIGHWAPVVDEL